MADEAIFTTLISAGDLARLVADGAVAVFDCSFDLADPNAGARAFAEGHIPGARYLHLDNDLSAPPGEGGRHPLPDADDLAARLRAAGLSRGRQVVAYDRSGGPYAARLWWLLRWLGHEAVAVLDGGLAAWKEAGGALEAGVPPPPEAGTFGSPNPGAAPVVGVDDVWRNIASGDRLVLDARPPHRFAGQPDPLDPVAGHIPGARNRFYRDNLDASGRFLPPVELAAAFRAVLGDFAPDRTILQCGSGVTACHNALAMAAAGLGGAALYPGSWSEWIRDPARPIARGGD
ncbi:MAG: sulfurtransferase [Novosphingobium sp.]|nr:sulfurtransferase [Novosphingobium sp.]